MGPDNTKVLDTSAAGQLGEDSIEDITKQVAAEAGDDGLSAFIVVIRHPGEGP